MMVWLGENQRGKRKCWGDDNTQKYCYILCVLIFPHTKVSRGGGFYFLHPWVSTFIVCHTTFLWAPFFFLSQGPFKDIILYKNTQLLSDGNAPWLWLSGCLGNSRQDVSQAFRRAEQIQGSHWWKEVVTWGDICTDPWWACAWRANSQLVLPFTSNPWWCNNYLPYIMWGCFSPLGAPVTTTASLPFSELCSQISTLHPAH